MLFQIDANDKEGQTNKPSTKFNFASELRLAFRKGICGTDTVFSNIFNEMLAEVPVQQHEHLSDQQAIFKYLCLNLLS